MITKDKTLSIRIAGELKKKLEREAKKRKLSVSELIAREMAKSLAA